MQATTKRAGSPPYPRGARYLPPAQRQLRGVLYARGQAALSHGARQPRRRSDGAAGPGGRNELRRLAVSPRLRFATVAGRWLERFEAKVAAGERRERTLEAHRYYLNKQLLPTLGRCLMRPIGVEDVAELLTALRANGCSEKTAAGALATLHSIVRFAIRNDWIIDDP